MTLRAPYLDDGDVRLYVGDCVEVMREMDADSVDAVVCDPPYGLEFMGNEWDTADSPAAFAAWCETWAREALRVLKPGGHLLAFGGTRTFHRLTCGIEDAGFEIRDCLSWLYGCGFPKSLDVSKAIDKKRDDRADVERVVRWLEAARVRSGVTRREVEDYFGTQNIGQALFTITPGSAPRVATWEQWEHLRALIGFGDEMDAEVWRLNGRKGQPGEAWKDRPVTGTVDEWQDRTNYALTSRDGLRRDIPATDAARQWQGWGTALKPAWEPCVVARKPLVGTVAENVQQHGTGALNVDGCRIGTEQTITHRGGSAANPSSFGEYGRPPGKYLNPPGRWPANVAFDEQAAAMLDAQTGERPSGARRAGDYGGIGAGPLYGEGGITALPEIEANTGGASRFFYTAKASRADRSTNGANNTHPTVKPTDLMRWLVRLVTPPGGLVLDPFAGSGSTLVAARAEGVRAVGIEREDEYARIISDRLAQLSLFTEGME